MLSPLFGDPLSESDTADSTIEEEMKNMAKRKSGVSHAGSVRHLTSLGRRETLIEEFVRSEAIHVEALKSVIVDYLGPLRERKMLDVQEQKDLFWYALCALAPTHLLQQH